MKKRLPRKIKKAARSISVTFIPEVVEEKHSGNECAIILNTKVKYKTKIGRMTRTMLYVIRKMELERQNGILRLGKIAEERVDFKKLMNDKRPLIVPSVKPGMATRGRSLLQEDVKKITFNNGVTMKFLPWCDPTTGKTY